MSEVSDAPKEKQGSDASGLMESAASQVELTATKLAVAKTLLQAAEKEHQDAIDSLAKAAAEAEKEYAAIAKASTSAAKPLTNKRNEERIFRREMGEPEFFRSKKDLIPKRPILSEEEQEEVSRKVEEFTVDATPQYAPKYVLSPEFAGTSNYESAISELVAKAKTRLAQLQNDSSASTEQIAQVERELEYLASLNDSYFYSMNVFRTAHNGRKITK